MAIKLGLKLNITNIKSPILGIQSSIPKITTPELKTIVSLKNQPAKLVDTVKSDIKIIDSVIAVERKVSKLKDIIGKMRDNISSMREIIKSNVETIKNLAEEFAKYLLLDAEITKKQILAEEALRKQDDEQALSAEEEKNLEGVGKRTRKFLLGPIAKVGKKIKGIFSKVVDFFKLVFIGWLGNKGFDAIDAWKAGDTEALKKIRSQVVNAALIVGGTLLALNVGLAALPILMSKAAGKVFAMGKVITAFLFSKAGLIALAAAAGIGGSVWLMKELGKRNAGGSGFVVAEEKLNNMKKTLNMRHNLYQSTESVPGGGFRTVWKIQDPETGVPKDIEKYGTTAQKEALSKYQAEQKRIEGLRNEMNTKLNQVAKNVPKTGLTGGQGNNEIKVHSKEDKEIIKQKKKEIRDEYNNLILKGIATPPPTTSATNNQKEALNYLDTIQNTDFTSKFKQQIDPKLLEFNDNDKTEVEVVRVSSNQNRNQMNQSRPSSSVNVPDISTSDPSNFYTMYSQNQYNVVV